MVNLTPDKIDVGTSISINGAEVLNSSGNGLFSGDVTVQGDLFVSGTTTTINTELQTADRYILLNSEYTGNTPVSSGLVLNINPDPVSFSIVDITNNVISVGGTDDPSSELAAGDFLLVQNPANSSNAGVYEVLSVSTTSNTVTIDSSPTEAFTGTGLVDDASIQGVIIGVTLTVMRSDAAGVFGTATGSSAPLVFSNVLTVSSVDFLNIGSTSSANSTGDLAASDATREMHYDASLGVINLTGQTAVDAAIHAQGVVPGRMYFYAQNTSSDAAASADVKVECAGVALSVNAYSPNRVLSGSSGPSTCRVLTAGVPGGLNFDHEGGIYQYGFWQSGILSWQIDTSRNLIGTGARSILTDGASALTLDTGGAAALNLGQTNANTVNIGHDGIDTRVRGGLRVGTPTTSNPANGDIVAGMGTAQFWWDESVGYLRLDGRTNPGSNIQSVNAVEGEIWWQNQNTGTGAAARALIATIAIGSSSLQMISHSAGFTPSTYAQPIGNALLSNGSGGLNISTGTGGIYQVGFWQNDVLSWQIDTSRSFVGTGVASTTATNVIDYTVSNTQSSRFSNVNTGAGTLTKAVYTLGTSVDGSSLYVTGPSHSASGITAPNGTYLISGALMTAGMLIGTAGAHDVTLFSTSLARWAVQGGGNLVGVGAKTISATGALTVDSTGALTLGPAAATSVVIGAGDIATKINGWLNVGTTALATAEGDFSAGLSSAGGSRFSLDQSAHALTMLTVSGGEIATFAIGSPWSQTQLKITTPPGQSGTRAVIEMLDSNTQGGRATGIEINAGSGINGQSPNPNYAGGEIRINGGEGDGVSGGQILLIAGNCVYTSHAPAGARLTLSPGEGPLGSGNSKGGAASLSGGNVSSTSSYVGGALTLEGGNTGTGTGGLLTVRAGDGGVSGVGGAATFRSGDGGSSSGGSGNVDLDAGSVMSGTAGTVTIGGTNASALTLGRAAIATKINGWLDVGTGTSGTLAAGDFRAGNATNDIFFDSSAPSFQINGTGAVLSSDSSLYVAVTGSLTLHSNIDNIYLTGTGATTTLQGNKPLIIEATGALTIGPAVATSVTIGANDIGTKINGWLNVGASTIANAQGDFASFTANGSNLLYEDGLLGVTRFIPASVSDRVVCFYASHKSTTPLSIVKGYGTSIGFNGQNAGGAGVAIGYTTVEWQDPSNGAEYADFIVTTLRNNSMTDMLRVGNSIAATGAYRLEIPGGGAMFGTIASLTAAEAGDIVAGDATHSMVFDASAATLTVGDGSTGTGVVAVGEEFGTLASIKHVEIELTGVTGATVTATSLIPAGSMVMGVTTRVTTSITTATSFDVGDGTDANRWGTQSTVTIGETTSPTDFVDNTILWQTSTAGNVVLTAGGGSFDGTGAIRIVVTYMSLTAPTS